MTGSKGASAGQVIRFQRQPSSGFSSGAVSEKFSGRPFDVLGMRRVLPGRWMDFLHAHFSDHVHVAYTFGVDPRTARNWWEGIGSPRPEPVLLAIV
jgi:hypothetical protein